MASSVEFCNPAIVSDDRHTKDREEIVAASWWNSFRSPGPNLSGQEERDGDDAAPGYNAPDIP